MKRKFIVPIPHTEVGGERTCDARWKSGIRSMTIEQRYLFLAKYADLFVKKHGGIAAMVAAGKIRKKRKK